MADVLILGAGPGGLAAGCYLAQNSRVPMVIEKETYPGGLCHTMERNGFRFDIGGHRWFTKNAEVDTWIKQLMGPEFLEVKRISRIYYEGKYFLYPLGIPDVVRNMGLKKSILGFCSFLLSRFIQKAPVTMEDAYIKQFGRELYSIFFRGYSEKVWGRSCNQLSADWVEQRTKGLSIIDALRKAIFSSSSKVTSLVESFHYPKTGYQRISERMAEEMIARGGDLHLGTSVKKISVKGERIHGVTVETGGTQTFVKTDSLISSIPLNLLIRMLEPAPPSAILEAAGKLQFRDLITVNIELNQDRVSEDTWIYIHDPAIPFARLHEPKNWSSAMAPAGKTSLVVEFFCTIGDSIWSRTDEELCETAIHHLSETLGFFDRNNVSGSFAFRAPRAYPVYALDYQHNLQLIKDYLSQIRNLQIVGRGGTFRYNNSDHSIEMGMLAAKNLLGETHQIDQVNSAREYLEEKVLT